MLKARTYRNIAAKVRFFGLEVGDWGILAAIVGVLFAVSDVLIVNLAVMVGVWLWMWRVKARKPEGYTLSLFSFLASPRSLPVEPERVNQDVERQS